MQKPRRKYNVFNSEKCAVIQTTLGYGCDTRTNIMTIHADGTESEYRPWGRWCFSNSAEETAEWIRGNVADSYPKFYALALCVELTDDEKERALKLRESKFND